MADESARGPNSRWWLLFTGFVLVAGLTAAIFVWVRQAGEVSTTTTSVQAAPVTTTTAPVTTSTSVPPTTTTTEPPVRVLSFTPTADTTVQSDAPAESFGDEAELVADGDDGAVSMALLSFTVTGLPADLSEIRATLRVTIVDTSDQEGTVSEVDGEWDATTTWDEAPTLGDGITTLPVTPEGSTLELDVTPSVTGDGVVDFYVTVDSGDDLEIASSETGSAGPVLIVTVGELAAGPPALLVGAADIASCEGEGDEATADLIESVIGDREDVIVFTLGDAVYETGTLEAYETCYESSWGRFRDFTRPAPGSRDYVVGSADGYYAYFGDRTAGEGDGYYSYHHGAWRIFVLNSNCSRVGGCSEGTPQYEWFVSQLESTEALCTMAYWQRPAYSSGTSGPDARMLPLFDAAASRGVDVVLNGNDHLYERFAPREAGGGQSDSGTRQFTVGTGGRSLDSFGITDSLSEFPYNESFGVLVLELAGGSYTWRFETTEQGTVDSGTSACN